MDCSHLKIPVFLCLLVSVLLFCGCSEDGEAVKVDMSIRKQIILNEEPDAIQYAYLPQYSHTVSYSRHNALIQYLKKETGLNIRQIFPDTFDQHMKMVGQNKIDISFSNPFIYLNIANRFNAKAFARIVEAGGREDFRGQIICRSDNPAIQSINDCRDKKWIAVDLNSAGGYLYPLGLFFDHGITQKDFKEIAFAPGPGGKQEKVILSVYTGKYDIGTIREGSLDIVSDKIDVRQIKIIATTDPYPGWVYAARDGFDPEKLEKIKSTLLKLDISNPEHRKILEAGNFIRVIPSDDSYFDSVRKLARKVMLETAVEK